MKKAFKSLLITATATAALFAAPVSEAVAQQCVPGKQFKTQRKIPAMTPTFYKRFERANELVSPATEGGDQRDAATKARDMSEALEEYQELIDRSRTNDYERASAYQMMAQVYFEREDTLSAIQTMEKILTVSHSIREPREHGILFNLAQLWYMMEDYDKSVNYVKRWLALGKNICSEPTTTQKVFIAQLYYTREEYANALDFLYAAIDEAKANPELEVKENWYLMAAAAHYELNQLPKYRDVLEILVVNWGKPNYYIQLAGVYSEMGDEDTFYSLQEAAYKMGFVDDKPSQIVNTAQIMFARNAPIKAAWILEKGFKEERIEDNERNRKLLGQAYMMASEYKKSVAPLKAAAQKSGEGELWFQVGQVELQNTDYRSAVTSFDKAISNLKMSVKKEKSMIISAMLLKGNALTELGRYSEAKKTFAQVVKVGNKSHKRQARAWNRYVDSEIARVKMLKGDT